MVLSFLKRFCVFLSLSVESQQSEMACKKIQEGQF